jgi:hypothetical protein
MLRCARCARRPAGGRGSRLRRLLPVRGQGPAKAGPVLAHGRRGASALPAERRGGPGGVARPLGGAGAARSPRRAPARGARGGGASRPSLSTRGRRPPPPRRQSRRGPTRADRLHLEGSRAPRLRGRQRQVFAEERHRVLLGGRRLEDAAVRRDRRHLRPRAARARLGLAGPSCSPCAAWPTSRRRPPCDARRDAGELGTRGRRRPPPRRASPSGPHPRRRRPKVIFRQVLRKSHEGRKEANPASRPTS